jgi:hypothetical protein
VAYDFGARCGKPVNVTGGRALLRMDAVTVAVDAAVVDAVTAAAAAP